MSYKWLELWSNKNKWKLLHILIIFNLALAIKEGKDVPKGQSLEGDNSFCLTVLFSPKWKAECIIEGLRLMDCVWLSRLTVHIHTHERYFIERG